MSIEEVSQVQGRRRRVWSVQLDNLPVNGPGAGAPSVLHCILLKTIRWFLLASMALKKLTNTFRMKEENSLARMVDVS